jgi:hypothetical protein
MTATVTSDRWQRAQNAELKWWTEPGEQEQRLRDRIDDAAWYAGLLNIAAVTVRDRHVLDIGGGPLPIAQALSLPLARLTVLDPMRYHAPAPVGVPFPTQRIYEPAEVCTLKDSHEEVWGYNVLQHVIAPEAVIATAKRAAPVVRWLDWVNTPVHEIHPHTMSANWLRMQFATGWRITFDTEGTIRRPGWSHHFIALVAERT